MKKKSGATGGKGKPVKAKGSGANVKPDREQSVKGQPRGVDSIDPAAKGKKGVPFKKKSKLAFDQAV
jgi:hypothetical protein